MNKRRDSILMVLGGAGIVVGARFLLIDELRSIEEGYYHTGNGIPFMVLIPGLFILGALFIIAGIIFLVRKK